MSIFNNPHRSRSGFTDNDAFTTISGFGSPFEHDGVVTICHPAHMTIANLQSLIQIDEIFLTDYRASLHIEIPRTINLDQGPYIRIKGLILGGSLRITLDGSRLEAKKLSIVKNVTIKSSTLQGNNITLEDARLTSVTYTGGSDNHIVSMYQVELFGVHFSYQSERIYVNNCRLLSAKNSTLTVLGPVQNYELDMRRINNNVPSTLTLNPTGYRGNGTSAKVASACVSITEGMYGKTTYTRLFDTQGRALIFVDSHSPQHAHHRTLRSVDELVLFNQKGLALQPLPHCEMPEGFVVDYAPYPNKSFAQKYRAMLERMTS